MATEANRRSLAAGRHPPGRDLGAGQDAEGEAEADALEVALGGALVDGEPLADLAVGEALGHEGGDLPLPGREGRRRRSAYLREAEERADAADQPGGVTGEREVRAAGHDLEL